MLLEELEALEAAKQAGGVITAEVDEEWEDDDAMQSDLDMAAALLKDAKSIVDDLLDKRSGGTISARQRKDMLLLAQDMSVYIDYMDIDLLEAERGSLCKVGRK